VLVREAVHGAEVKLKLALALAPLSGNAGSNVLQGTKLARERRQAIELELTPEANKKLLRIGTQRDRQLLGAACDEARCPKTCA